MFFYIKNHYVKPIGNRSEFKLHISINPRYLNLVIKQLTFSFLENPIYLNNFSHLFTILCILLFISEFEVCKCEKIPFICLCGGRFLL